MLTAVKKAMESLSEFEPDLVLLDLMLPDGNGLDLCKFISINYPIPTIILTAKNDTIDKIIGLEFGADDYITKPFNLREVLTRINVIFRRLDKAKSYISKGAEKMEIIQNFTPEEIDRIEHMLSLRYMFLSKPVKNRSFYFKLLCILTPMLYLFSIEIFRIGYIPVFVFCIVTAVISSIGILFHLFVGVKNDKKLHDLLQQRLGIKYSIYIDLDKIILKDIEYSYDDVRYAIYLESFLFIFTKDPKYMILKVTNDEKAYIKEILSNYKNITQEEKIKLFNVFVYLRKSKEQ